MSDTMTLADVADWMDSYQRTAVDPACSEVRLRRAATVRAAIKEIATLRLEIARLNRVLGDTIAVLNRDGGHHQGEVGDKQAAEDGLKRFHAMDGLLARCAERINAAGEVFGWDHTDEELIADIRAIRGGGK